MVSVTADEFQALMNLSDTDISNANAERVIDQAVNKLNSYGAELPNMAGSSGTKTLSCESNEKGAILEVARITYWAYYKGQETVTISSLSTRTPNMLNNPTVEATIEKLAKQLIDIEADVG